MDERGGERHDQHGVEEERDGGVRVMIFEPAVKKTDGDGEGDGAVDDEAGAEEAEEFFHERQARGRGGERGISMWSGDHPGGGKFFFAARGTRVRESFFAKIIRGNARGDKWCRCVRVGA